MKTNGKVRNIKSARERKSALGTMRLGEAMSYAISVLGGTATADDIAEYLSANFRRQWAKGSIKVYLYFMSKPQRFAHTPTRGVFKNTRMAEAIVAAMFKRAA